MTWSENSIARALVRQTFNRKYLVVVPNCNWTGHECDLLAVTENLRIIDVEIKISRADLKADAKKEKWWHREHLGYWPTVSELRHNPRMNELRLEREYRRARYKSTPKDWPRKVWKHYYALPKEIWHPDLLAALPSRQSGVLLLDREGYPRPVGAAMRVECIRRAQPNRDAPPISPAAAVDIARLASLRMWEAYARLEKTDPEGP
ncbi:Uncharacterised protein [Achromobacter sp. 2789STDY5608633]|uniref:hypothetical protein n=1 Tax=Achromobacter TaxID=222 RepID=UPI0006C6ACAF|nr:MULTISPECIES: hypothetical protein [Achromobacter]CUJ46700.1 Uncharacterised protein [Achromobacter sp. 2789STDY5608633]CUK19189.1 Uncharacterised protein [Achromobacter xylosoxidans]